MRISATIFVILISTCVVNASVLDPVIENVVHFKASKPPTAVAGIWKKKTIWKPRWVKEWKSAKVMKPIWKKVWSPVQIREWVPIPKPPPGWDSFSTPLAPKHQKVPTKDSTGHSSSAVPLWDPIPYPESQQPPPPPPFSQPVYDADSSCDKGTCDNSHSGTFNHQQISEIIGSRYGTPDHYQNSEYSETVNHLTYHPADGKKWRPQLPDAQSGNPFDGFPGLPEFLVPPIFQPLPEGNFRWQAKQQPFFNPLPVPPQGSPSSALFEPPNGLRQWTPFPAEMKTKGHFITKPSAQPYKFKFPELEMHIRNATETHSNNDSKEISNVNAGFRLQTDGDTVQEAQLVGEYHYSGFDLPKLKKPEESDQVKVKQQQKLKMPPPDANKQKTNGPPPESRQKQNRTATPLETHRPQNGQHVQKKHVPGPPSNTSNFIYHQQKATITEILPHHRFPVPLNDDSNNHKQHHPINLSSTLLVAVEQEPNSSGANLPPHRTLSQSSNSVLNTLSANDSNQQQKRYPGHESPENLHDHRFSPNINPDSANNVSTPYRKYYPVYEMSTAFPSNHGVPVPWDAVDSSNQSSKSDHSSTRSSSPLSSSAVVPGTVIKSDKPSLERHGSVQLVFPTIDDVTSGRKFNGLPAEVATTTEPFPVIFSSSSVSKTEAATKSPVLIVTPVVERKS